MKQESSFEQNIAAFDAWKSANQKANFALALVGSCGLCLVDADQANPFDVEIAFDALRRVAKDYRELLALEEVALGEWERTRAVGQ